MLHNRSLEYEEVEIFFLFLFLFLRDGFRNNRLERNVVGVVVVVYEEMVTDFPLRWRCKHRWNNNRLEINVVVANIVFVVVVVVGIFFVVVRLRRWWKKSLGNKCFCCCWWRSDGYWLPASSLVWDMKKQLFGKKCCYWNCFCLCCFCCFCCCWYICCCFCWYKRRMWGVCDEETIAWKDMLLLFLLLLMTKRRLLTYGCVVGVNYKQLLERNVFVFVDIVFAVVVDIFVVVFDDANGYWLPASSSVEEIVRK